MNRTVQDLVGHGCANQCCVFYSPDKMDCEGGAAIRARCECRNDHSELSAAMRGKAACGKCGSTSLNDLGHGKKGLVICLNCQAKWWERWRTKKGHEDYINMPNAEHEPRREAT